MTNRHVVPELGSEWVVGACELSATIAGDAASGGELVQPTAILWVEAASGFVLAIELSRAGEVASDVGRTLIDTLRGPKAGRPPPPARVRVASSELAAALRATIAGDRELATIEVVVGPTPELAPVVASLQERFGPSQGELSLLGGGATPELVEYFFAATAQLHQVAPWKHAPPDVFWGVQCAALGIEAGALSVVGQMGTSFGFALFRAEGDAVMYLEAIDEAEATGQRPPFVPEHVMLSFDREAPPSIIREIEEHRWPTHRDAIPCAVMVQHDFTARPLTGDELIGLTAVVRALATLVLDEQPALQRAWRGVDSLIRSYRIEGPTRAVDVTLMAPLHLPIHDGDLAMEDYERGLDDDLEAGLDDDLGDGLDAGLDDAARDELKTRTDAMIEHLVDTGALTPELRGWAELLSGAAIDYYGRMLGDVSPAQLADLVFGLVPRKVSCGPEDAPAVIAALRALLEYVAHRDGGEHARVLLGTIPADASQRLARELANPENFGMAKQFVMAGVEAGFDMTSETGVQAFLQAFGGRLPATPRRTGRRTKRAVIARGKAAKVTTKTAKAAKTAKTAKTGDKRKPPATRAQKARKPQKAAASRKPPKS